MDILICDSEQPTKLICAYSPTNSSKKQTREKFYSCLSDIVTPSSWLLGDLNARVGRCNPQSTDTDFDVQSMHAVGPWSLKGDITLNQNGSLLVDIAVDNRLRHVSSNFNCRDSKRWTWRHPRYGNRAVLDHMFLPASQLRFVYRCKVAPAIAVSSDHRLSFSELCFRPRQSKAKEIKPVVLNKRVLQEPDIQSTFQAEINNILGEAVPEDVPTDELSKRVRSAAVEAAQKVLPRVTKQKFPAEFSKETMELIASKRASWKLQQKSGKRFTRTNKAIHQSLCKRVKEAVAFDRNQKLEREASELTEAFSASPFKGYSLLKKQHRAPAKAIMPPESDFTVHYSNQYKPDTEQPLVVDSCDLPASEYDDNLSRENFDSGINSLNENRSPGVDDCAPEYIKRGGPKLLQWLFVLMTRLWTFVTPPFLMLIGLVD